MTVDTHKCHHSTTTKLDESRQTQSERDISHATPRYEPARDHAMRKELTAPIHWQKVIFFFGASFNPPTKAHVGIMKWLTEIEAFDENSPPNNTAEDHDISQALENSTRKLSTTVLAAPVYKHAFASSQQTKSNMPDFEHRKKLTEIAIGVSQTSASTNADIQVSSVEKAVIENKMALNDHSATGTVDIIQYLNNQYKNALIIPVVGQDAFEDINAGKWKGGTQLLEMAPILIIGRSADPTHSVRVSYPKNNNSIPRLIWKDCPQSLSGISSTEARNAKDPDELRRFLPCDTAKNMMRYMSENQLYLWQHQRI